MRKRPAATCHPDREHYAKGLCRACYEVAQRVKRSPAYYAQRKAKYKEDPVKRRARNNRWYRTHPEWRLLEWARRRAREKSVEFTITRDDIKIPEVCPILGIPLSKEGSGSCYPNRDASPSLDRINPKLGYVPGNVVVISNRANTIKNSGTAEEHYKIADWIRKNKKDS